MNPFDVFQQPMLYLVRHGETDLNDANRFRGWSDVPLNDQGIEAAEEIANYLSYRAIGKIACSNLQRAIQTATAITNRIAGSPPPDRNANLRPWNIGDFADKSKAKYQSALQRYIDDPDLLIPEGESLNQFRQRWEDSLNAYMQEAVYELPVVLVVHTSNITAAHQILDPEGNHGSPEDGDIVEPGGIVAVYMGHDGTPVLVPVLGAVVSESTPSAT